MLLKIEEVAEERQTVVRCGAANRVSVLPATTPALEEVGLDVSRCTVLVTAQIAACICDFLPALEHTRSRQDILSSSQVKTKQIILS